MNNVPNSPLLRRLERWLVGSAMAVMAYLLEKTVLRSIRRGGAKP
ncbi:MAG TPA: hypothetical protein VNL74_10475 [Methylococcus sp.]|nr:hypothetical protein [Methylococcus sp.]